MLFSAHGSNQAPDKIQNKMTSSEKLIAAQSIIADMSRLANETPEQAAARITFFGEDCDKLAVLAGHAAKLATLLAS